MDKYLNLFLEQEKIIDQLCELASMHHSDSKRKNTRIITKGVASQAKNPLHEEMMSEARQEERLKIARRAILLGVNLELIQELTGINIQDLQRLSA